MLHAHPNLWWLTDVPMFIDERSVDRLYGAIVQPEYILLQANETAEKSRSSTEGNELEAAGEISAPAFFKVGTKAKLSGSETRAATLTSQVTKQFVYSSEQRLQDVVVAYKERSPERVLFEEPVKEMLATLAGKPVNWLEAEALLGIPGPRPLLFLDLPPLVPILPMAGEMSDGKVVPLYKDLVERLADAGSIIPEWPKDGQADTAGAKNLYWKALLDSYDNRIALEVIENGFSSGERIEWIDYRLKLATREKPVHLHFTPAGNFPTGAFAFNLVRRGYKVGLRIVGQLRKGCDINVLALYER